MKTLIILFFTLPFVTNALTISEAYADKDIELRVTGDQQALSSTALKIEVLNHKNKAITLTAAPGYIFDSEEDDVQDLILTEPLMVVVNAGEKSIARLNAMCIQASNKTPGEENLFLPSNKVDERLIKASQFIHQNDYQNHMGQDAIWALSDNHSIYSISGPAEIANPIRSFIADLTNMTFDTSLINKNERYVERTIKEYALYLKFYLQQSDDIKLQLFDHKGDFQRNLLMKENQSRGKYDMKYKISLLGLVGQKYYVRLFVGDEERTEFVLVVKEG